MNKAKCKDILHLDKMALKLLQEKETDGKQMTSRRYSIEALQYAISVLDRVEGIGKYSDGEDIDIGDIVRVNTPSLATNIDIDNRLLVGELAIVYDVEKYPPDFKSKPHGIRVSLIERKPPKGFKDIIGFSYYIKKEFKIICKAKSLKQFILGEK